jgi:hypothetical protein
MHDDDHECCSYQINVSVVKGTRHQGYAGILTVIEMPRMREVTRPTSSLRGRFFREPAQALAAAVSEGQRLICDVQREHRSDSPTDARAALAD